MLFDADLAGLDQQKKLLSTEVLVLSEDLRVIKLEDGNLTVKNIPQKTYLTISPHFWRVLQRFKTPISVTELLPVLITDRETPALREFYELLLKSLQARILAHHSHEPKQIRAVEWPLSIRQKFGTSIAVLFIMFGFLSALFSGVEVPDLLGIIFGVIPLSLSLSLGYVLAACALRGYDCEIYNPSIHYRTLIPHFRIDLDEAQMGGRECQITVALLRLAPIFLFCGIAAIWFPSVLYLTVLGVFYLTDPFGESPGRDLVRFLFRKTQLCIHRDFLFIRNRHLSHVYSVLKKHFDKSYLLAMAVHCVFWLASFMLFHFKLLHLDPEQLLHPSWKKDGLLALVFSLCVVAGVTVQLVPALGRVWKAGKLLWEETKKSKIVPLRRDRTRELIPEVIYEFLRRNVIFSQCSDEKLRELTMFMDALEYKRHHVVVKEDSEDDNLYMIYSGGVEFVRKTLAGRYQIIDRLGVADVFRAADLLNKPDKNCAVRTSRNTVLLALRRKAYDSLLLNREGAERFHQTLRKAAFLNRIKLCQHWAPEQVIGFAETAVIDNISKGRAVVHRGQANQFFCIVYKGFFDILVGGKKVAILSIGDFFGEISLLQNSVATADVMASEECQVLAIHKNAFIKFLGRDFDVAMEFEEVASSRLGAPIFPLRGKSFDAAGAV